jgi:hypothetical protein
MSPIFAGVAAGIGTFVWPDITLYVVSILVAWYLVFFGILHLVSALAGRAGAPSRPSAGAVVPTSRRARPSAGGREQPVGREKAPQGSCSGYRRQRSKPASRHRTYGANPLSIQVRKRWTLSAGHGP